MDVPNLAHPMSVSADTGDRLKTFSRPASTNDPADRELRHLLYEGVLAGGTIDNIEWRDDTRGPVARSRRCLARYSYVPYITYHEPVRKNVSECRCSLKIKAGYQF
jgi:hypothetical protein